jgi:hypothetical protein
MQTKTLANSPANAVAYDGEFRDAPRNGHAQARRCRVGGFVFDLKCIAAKALGVLAQAREIAGFEQARGARQAQQRHGATRVLRNEVLAALGATGIEHRTSAASLHASTESVRAGMFQLAGLESAFHGTALKINEKGREK